MPGYLLVLRVLSSAEFSSYFSDLPQVVTPPLMASLTLHMQMAPKCASSHCKAQRALTLNLSPTKLIVVSSILFISGWHRYLPFSGYLHVCIPASPPKFLISSLLPSPFLYLQNVPQSSTFPLPPCNLSHDISCPDYPI